MVENVKEEFQWIVSASSSETRRLEDNASDHMKRTIISSNQKQTSPNPTDTLNKTEMSECFCPISIKIVIRLNMRHTHTRDRSRKLYCHFSD